MQGGVYPTAAPSRLQRPLPWLTADGRARTGLKHPPPAEPSNTSQPRRGQQQSPRRRNYTVSKIVRNQSVPKTFGINASKHNIGYIRAC